MTRHHITNIVSTILVAVVAIGCEIEGLRPIEREVFTRNSIDDNNAGGDNSGGDDSGDNNPGDNPIDNPGDDTAGACGFVSSTFAVPRDELSCDGPSFVRFDGTINLFVGVVTCGGPDEVRVYLSERDDGPFFQAADWAGHGQDHCALVNPSFALGNEDDITSGGCASCSTSTNLPLEGVAVWARGTINEQFQFVAVTPEWSHQTSRLRCGIDVASCAAVGEPVDPVDPVDPVEPPPPQGQVPCSAGATVDMRFEISAADMRNGASDESGPGVCFGPVTFAEDLAEISSGGMALYEDDGFGFDIATVEFNGSTWPACDTYHCGTLVYGSGESRAEYCTVWALCDAETGMAEAVGFTW